MDNLFFFTHLWPGLLLWSALYVSDYTLTIACARLYQLYGKDKVIYGGSYELNPYFEPM